jgi:endo-1,4-beta-mannosidase
MTTLSRRDLFKAGLGGALAALVPPHEAACISRPIGIAPAGRRIRFGLNYVPPKNWWYCWSDWDAKSVREDLQAIADLGMDHIRIQCLWPLFQPGINFVSARSLERLQELLDLAHGAALDVEVAVLDGWLSGFAFLPAWVTPLATDSSRKIFTNPEIIEAEKLLFTEIGKSIGNHPRFLGFDLGNEVGVLQKIDTLKNSVSQDEADNWATTMLAHCEEICPGKFHVNGVDDTHWFADMGFSRQNLGQVGSATVVHCYAYWTGALDHYRYDQAGSLHLAEYMVELARAYQTNDQRQVWVQEVGTSSEWMPENYITEYASTLLQKAAACQNVWGFTWWCSHDIDPAMKGFLSLEYGLGVLDQQNRVKPLGRTLSKLAEEWRKNPPTVISRPVALVIPDNGLSKNGDTADWSIAKQYMDLVSRGTRPAMVLASRVEDKAYLKDRGIEELVKAAVP